MTLYSFASLDEAPPPDKTLSALADALRAGYVGADRRVLASPDSRSPDEGLALLDAYVSIADVDVRQAILDTVIGIAKTNPYRRSRATTRRTAGDRKA